MPAVLEFGEAGPLLVLGIILVAGTVGGMLARWAHIPVITGNLLAGLLIGPYGLNMVTGADIAGSLRPLSTFAMALIAVAVGSQLSYRRIHNALRRIISIAMCETAGAVILVTLATRYVAGVHWTTAFVLGCIAAATAPATTVAVIRETHAKGSFVKTLLSVVALDNMFCIMLFAFSSTLMADFLASGTGSMSIRWALAHTAWQFFGSILLGVLLGVVTKRLVHRGKSHDFSVVFVVILLSAGLSSYFDLNALLTSLFLGVYLGNSSEEVTRQTEALEPIEMLLFACFFTLAGASLHLNTIPAAGLPCLAYLLARFAGKAMGACAGGLLGQSSKRIWLSSSLGLVPQAGVAIGLVVLLGGDDRIDAELRALIETVVLGAVIVNEIAGPLFTRLALRLANETGKDRRRLIEFLQEEFILVDVEAKDKWEALRKLTDFYCRTHNVPAADRAPLYATIEQREKDHSTAIGRGAAIPHGRIDRGTGIRGVLAILKQGVGFDAPDGGPVRLMMLVVTPKGHEKEHLEVMSSLAQIISHEAIRTRLLAAINANDAWEIIESEETPTYNYFLEDSAAEGEKASS